MRKFVLRRLMMMPLLLLGISVLIFTVMRLAPGDPATLSVAMDPRVDPSYIAKLRKSYGLDDPLPVQYWNWLKRVCVLDFGVSFKDNRPVLGIILERLPATLLLSGLSLALLFLIGVPLGVAAAYYQGRFIDRFVALLTFAGYSAPGFWIALMLMLLFGVQMGLLPISGMTSIRYEYLPWPEKVWDLLSHLLLPLVVTVFGGLASISRYTRNSMLEVIRQDYIRTARAKGLSEARVVFRHALPNALIPVVTLVGLALPGIIGGSVIIETIFAWPGMGRLAYESIMSRNYSVVIGFGMIAAFLTILGNFLADLAYAWLDPRIKYD